MFSNRALWDFTSFNYTDHNVFLLPQILKADYDKFGREGMTGLRVAPFHYGSHYSNSGSVLHFLVRLPPFTKLFLDFQGTNSN